MISTSFHDQVRVVPYQEEWVQRFRTTKEMIIDISSAVLLIKSAS